MSGSGFISNPMLFFAVLALLFLLFYLFKKTAIRKLKQLVYRTASKTDDMVLEIFESKGLPLLLICSVYVLAKYQILSDSFSAYLDKAFMLLLVFYITSILIKIVQIVIYERVHLRITDNHVHTRRSTEMLLVVKIIFWSLAFLFILDNLGFKVSSVITGLGIGGIAIALASQAFLGDLFNYFAIVFDKPFEEGDSIVIDKITGTIEHVGLKTTRIRSLEGEQVVISNTQLTNSTIRNYKKMEERRVAFSVGVTYGTGTEKLNKISEGIEQIIKQQEQTRFDRAHLKALGDFSIIFEIVYYVLSNDYNRYMDIQQTINYGIIKLFNKEGISFAYPTQVVKVESQNH